MELSATPNAERASMASAPFAGNLAHQGSAMMAPSVTNPKPTAEVSVMPSGTKTTAIVTTQMSAAKSGAPCGTPNARPISTTLPAASAPQTAPQA